MQLILTTLQSSRGSENIILTKWVIKVTGREGEREGGRADLNTEMIIKLSSRSPPGKSDGWTEGGITDGLDLDLTGPEINEHQQLQLLSPSPSSTSQDLEVELFISEKFHQ